MMLRTVLIGMLTAIAVQAQSVQERSHADDQELVRQLSNPVSSLVSVPFQNNFDFDLGADQGWRYTLNFQPVVPIKLNADWNLIVRTIVSFIHQEDLFKGALDQVTLPDNIIEALKGRSFSSTQNGLGDITQSFFFSPSKPGPGGIIWGIGPDFLYPSATTDLLGNGKWGAGPTAIVLKQMDGWTVGALANHLWSFAGDEDRPYVSRTFLQPFIAYATRTKTTFTVNLEFTYDWHAGQWTVPINFMVSQLVRVGKLPVSLQVGAVTTRKVLAARPTGACASPSARCFPCPIRTRRLPQASTVNPSDPCKPCSAQPINPRGYKRSYDNDLSKNGQLLNPLENEPV